ncbi:MAG TPA: recombinase family protein, partial [Armatimonadota bacterium]|nr:recombinase family protein [Armatimonadota bacterium]
AAKLTAIGVPTPSGKPRWSPSSIHEMIAEWDRLYQYSGIGFWNRRDCQRNKRNPRIRDTSEWIVVPDAHPAIITKSECDAIWAMVKDNKPAPKMGQSGQPSRWALSGGVLRRYPQRPLSLSHQAVGSPKEWAALKLNSAF